MVVKKTISKPVSPKKPAIHAKPKVAVSTAKSTGFFEAVGRRKTAIARVRFSLQGHKEIVVNGKPFDKYFPVDLQKIITNALDRIVTFSEFSLSVKVSGGGLHAQAEAIRHGLAHSLVKFDPAIRQTLKTTGFLTRDSRMRERKKFGLKRARRAPQWNKR